MNWPEPRLSPCRQHGYISSSHLVRPFSGTGGSTESREGT